MRWLPSDAEPLTQTLHQSCGRMHWESAQQAVPLIAAVAALAADADDLHFISGCRCDPRQPLTEESKENCIC